MSRAILVASLVLLPPLLIPIACGGRDTETAEKVKTADDAAVKEEMVKMALQISSPAFAHEQPIPARHACDGGDRSPALTWSGAPEGTQAFALICDDPDAPMGTWVHWTIFNIPGTATELPESLSTAAQLADGTIQGRNSWGRNGYGGPCPPPGKPHRYFFKLYALDAPLTLDSEAGKEELLAAIQGHILAEGQLMGTYQR